MCEAALPKFSSARCPRNGSGVIFESTPKASWGFYFRGPEGALRLRAQNLSTFLDLAVGVDDQTWMYHLREGAYSKWFREAIKDELMAAEAASVERNAALSALESRARIKAAVQQRYTVPAKKD